MILICGITLDAHGNKHRLKVRMAPDGSLSYHLKSYLGGTSFSLSNLQLKKPLPEMRSDTLDGTIKAILASLATGVEKPESIDKYAHVTTGGPSCPHCGGDQ